MISFPEATLNTSSAENTISKRRGLNDAKTRNTAETDRLITSSANNNSPLRFASETITRGQRERPKRESQSVALVSPRFSSPVFLVPLRSLSVDKQRTSWIFGRSKAPTGRRLFNSAIATAFFTTGYLDWLPRRTLTPAHSLLPLFQRAAYRLAGRSVACLPGWLVS